MGSESEALLPCPICGGVEGCDHTVYERRFVSRGSRALYEAQINGRFMGVADEVQRTVAFEKLPMAVRSGYARLALAVLEAVQPMEHSDAID